MAVKSIGIVGCGAIGQALLRAGDAGSLGVAIAGVTSRNDEKARAFLSTLPNPPSYLERDELISRSALVVETAGGHVVPGLAAETFAAGKDLMVISVGALLDHPEILEQSRKGGCRLFAPSGAIAGLDGIKSACVGGVSKVMVVSRKPPQALEGAPYLIERGISLAGLSRETELFLGTARDACRGFPSLAGLGPDKTLVRILAVPGLDRNCHDIEVEGEFGLLTVHVENVPTENRPPPNRPAVTALSIIRSVQDAADSEVGWEKWTPKSDKLERRRCQDEEGPARKVYQGIPAGSSEAGIGRESVIARGRASVVLTAIDVGVLGEAI